MAKQQLQFVPGDVISVGESYRSTEADYKSVLNAVEAIARYSVHIAGPSYNDENTIRGMFTAIIKPAALEVYKMLTGDSDFGGYDHDWPAELKEKYKDFDEDCVDGKTVRIDGKEYRLTAI